MDAATGLPLAGATVSTAGKAITSTDKEGNFNIDCAKVNRITISYIGFEAMQETIRNCDRELTISLAPISHPLDAVEITATSNPNKRLLYQPNSITKLDKMELKRSTGLFLDDAININIPGVTMQRRSVSGGQQFNIRGYGNGVRGTNGANSNFDGQGYKVYLNGIPVTDAEGITVMDDLDMASIGNVEVVKGPSGTLYGLAIAGVVNLNTIRPEKGKTSVGEDVLIGNYGLRRYTTHFQMGTDRSSLLLNYGYQKVDGYMVHTASKKRFFNAAGNFNVSEKSAINFYAGYSDSYDQRGGELTITQYNTKDYSGNPAYIQRNAHSAITSFRMGVGHTYTFNNHFSNTTTLFGSAASNNSSSAAGWTDKDPMNYGFRSTIDAHFQLTENITLGGITGMEAQKQNAQVVGYNMKADPANPTGYFKIDTMRSNQLYITGTKSIFTEWTLGLPQNLSVTAGVGMSTMDINLNDRFVRPNIARPMNYRRSYKGMVSPHFAINKVFTREISLYFSYSKGYKAPVSSYFFVPVSPSVGFVDSSLKPEIGNQFELGSKGSFLHDRIMYQLTVFNAIFSNKMTAVAVPLNPPAVGTAYTYVANGGKHNDKGVEALVKFIAYQSGKGILRLVQPFANATYSKFRYEDYKIEKLKSPPSSDTTIDYSGKPVAGVAPWVINLGVDIQAAYGIYASFTYSYKDGMPISSDNLNRATSYNLLNAKLGLRQNFGGRVDLDIYAGVNNIGASQYPYMVFVNQLPDAYLPAPLKAVVYGGINVKYNF